MPAGGTAQLQVEKSCPSPRTVAAHRPPANGKRSQEWPADVSLVTETETPQPEGLYLLSPPGIVMSSSLLLNTFNILAEWLLFDRLPVT